MRLTAEDRSAYTALPPDAIGDDVAHAISRGEFIIVTHAEPCAWGAGRKVDYPGRFARSRVLGAHFGLTPRKYQSGETDVTGAISRVGDAVVRVALYEAD